MLFALACGALALTMQPTAVGSLRTATPPCTAARGVIVRMEESKSTPETIAANKAKYEANKVRSSASRHARAPTQPLSCLRRRLRGRRARRRRSVSPALLARCGSQPNVPTSLQIDERSARASRPLRVRFADQEA